MQLHKKICMEKKHKTYKIVYTKDKLKGLQNERAKFSDKYSVSKSKRKRPTNRRSREKMQMLIANKHGKYTYSHQKT